MATVIFILDESLLGLIFRHVKSEKPLNGGKEETAALEAILVLLYFPLFSPDGCNSADDENDQANKYIIIMCCCKIRILNVRSKKYISLYGRSYTLD